MRRLSRLFQLIGAVSLIGLSTAALADDFARLLQAAQEGDLATVRELVERGVRVVDDFKSLGFDPRPSHHHCVLREAALHQKLEVIDYLVQVPRLREELENEIDHITHVSRNRPELLQSLDRLARNATPEELSKVLQKSVAAFGPFGTGDYRPAFGVLLSRGADVHTGCDLVLYAAASNKHPDLVEFFLEKGARIDGAIARFGERAQTVLKPWIK